MQPVTTPLTTSEQLHKKSIPLFELINRADALTLNGCPVTSICCSHEVDTSRFDPDRDIALIVDYFHNGKVNTAAFEAYDVFNAMQLIYGNGIKIQNWKDKDSFEIKAFFEKEADRQKMADVTSFFIPF